MTSVAGDVSAVRETFQAATVDFCDCETVQTEKATAFGRWAKEVLRWPPAGRVHEFLTIKITDSLGVHALSATAFKPGDLIISEAAILRVPPLSPQVEHQLERRFGGKSAFLQPALAVHWPSVTAEQQVATMTLFYAHQLIVTGQSSLIQATCRACAELIETEENLRDRWTVPDLVRFLHVVDLNIHRDGEVEDNSSFAGLFVFGSKFSNSCAPNCRWSFGTEGHLEYHAIRDIAPGEALTFSYIGNGLSLVEGTVARQRRLGALWFVCRCSRCTGPETTRQMRCPLCSAPHCAPDTEEESASKFIDWTGAGPLQDVIPEPKTWRCSSCEGTTPASRMPLDVERELSQLVPEVLGNTPETAANDRRRAWQLSQRASRELGPLHWTWVLAAFAWLQKSLMLLHHSSIIDFSESELQEVSSKVSKWFSTHVPDNVEQRLQALHLSLKLAKNFDDDFGVWGYAANDPMGDGSGRLADVVSTVLARGGGVVKSGALKRHTPASQKPFSGVWQ